jgi:para-nitrobenzyl esterase
MFFNPEFLLGFLSSVLLITSSAALSTRAQSATAKTRHSTVIGHADLANPINTFYGIPYAQPPVGKLRLQPPRPLTNPSGDINASDPNTNRCYRISQKTFKLVPGSEDCLTLDIVAPSVLPNNLLSVYVFIHGYVNNDLHVSKRTKQLISIGEISMMEINPTLMAQTW